MYRFLTDRLNRLIAFTWVNIYLKQRENRKGVTQNIDTDTYLWLPSFGFRYFFNDKIILDHGKINALSKLGVKFKIIRTNRIGHLTNKTIHLNYSDTYNWKYGFNDYTSIFHFFVKQLESQNNIVYPSSKEIYFWENKGFMHEKFIEYNISQPQTILCKTFDEVESLNWPFPFLVKEEHSSSSKGVHQIKSKVELQNLKIKGVFKPNEFIIVQKLIKMRRDLRVTLVGDKIVHYYWRINNSKEWKPTSTGRGSSVDFEYFPEKWREFIISEFKKLDIPTGAFDIAWENDNLDTTPLILEVSPTYQVNPKITNKKHLNEYGKFKRTSFIGQHSYIYQYIKQTHEIIEQVMSNFHEKR